MRFAALATDYDGTLALAGVVAPPTVHALERLQASGRRLVLVTGRELDELLEIFPAIDRFDRVVAENGALLYTPATRKRKELGQAPPGAFVAELERRGVPFSVGASIVATVHPHETAVLETIRDLGLELQVIFNKGAVMVLPASVNKASGLKVALDELGLSPRNVVAIGDAENDHALLRFAELGVAVANAVPMLCQGADLTSARDHGEAVIELIEQILADDLCSAHPREPRRHVLLGTDEHGADVRMPPAWVSVLVGGPDGSGKSVLAMGILERLRGEGYQYCVIDPAGRYAELAEAIVFGAAASGPTVGEIMTALEKPDACVVANLSAVPPAERAGFAGELLNRLDALRAASGRPHWILVDDAHLVLPRANGAAKPASSGSPGGRICVTAHADRVSGTVLQEVDIAVALGTAPEQVFAPLRPTNGVSTAIPGTTHLQRGQAILWDRRGGGRPVRITMAPSAAA